MFQFKLDKIKIHKNRETGGLFGKDLAEIELWSFVATDGIELPDIDELLGTTDSVKKKEFLANLATTVANSRRVLTLKKIKDDVEIEIGYDIYRSDTAPDYFDWNFIAIEIDDKQRETAKLIRSAVDDAEFGQLVDTLPTALLGAANPSFTAASAVTKLLVNVIGKGLANSDNDAVGILYKSFEKTQDYPKGKLKKTNVADLTANMWVDFSIWSDS